MVQKNMEHGPIQHQCRLLDHTPSNPKKVNALMSITQQIAQLTTKRMWIA
jgi:hypothetical protein